MDVGVLSFTKGEKLCTNYPVVQKQCLGNIVPFYKGDERSGGVIQYKESTPKEGGVF
jgi:hypothetical protein